MRQLPPSFRFDRFASRTAKAEADALPSFIVMVERWRMREQRRTHDLAVLVAKVGEVREHEVHEAVLAIVAHHWDGPVAEMVLRQLRRRQQEGALKKGIVGNGNADCSGMLAGKESTTPPLSQKIRQDCGNAVRWLAALGLTAPREAAALRMSCSRSSACGRGRAG